MVHAARPGASPCRWRHSGSGIGLIGASFMLAWAADAGEAVFSGGLVLAAVALVGVLPEFIIEVHFAFIQQAELVTANLTGATRLLLTGAVALPLLVSLTGVARHVDDPPIGLPGHAASSSGSCWSLRSSPCRSSSEGA